LRDGNATNVNDAAAGVTKIRRLGFQRLRDAFLGKRRFGAGDRDEEKR